MKNIIITLLLIPAVSFSQTWDKQVWDHLSSKNGDMEVPFIGNQQTACLVFDADNDGIQEIFMTERRDTPSVVMYKLAGEKWEKFIIHDQNLRSEAGGAYYDIDKDGDLDLVLGGGGGNQEIWWFENPFPEIKKSKTWEMHLIKNDGGKKHHDMIFGDFDGDGSDEFVFWNQKSQQLCLAEIPEDPRTLWEYYPIYEYSDDSQMEQRGQEAYPKFKGINEHEGIDKSDIDGDGIQDIVAGGSWFKFIGNKAFRQNIIDASYVFTRCAAGQLIPGGRPEVIIVVGDGLGPLILYKWIQGTWFGKVILEDIENGHTLDIVDFNDDGNLDVFVAEMRLNNDNPDAIMRVLLGDGKGNFKDSILTTGFGNHESRIVDLDGDGDYDIVGKPFNWDTPRFDIWINKSNK